MNVDNMWDTLLDGVDVHVEANLLNKCDMIILDILLGRRWSKLIKGGPFDIQGGGGFVFYWESDNLFVFI